MQETKQKIIDLETDLKILRFENEQLKKIIANLPTSEESHQESHKYFGHIDYAFISGYLEGAINNAKTKASYFDNFNWWG